jgi:hypothetical protein
MSQVNHDDVIIIGSGAGGSHEHGVVRLRFLGRLMPLLQFCLDHLQ